MKRITVKAVLLLLFAALLCGCKKDDQEEPTVTSHDFTVEQWADFIDKKKENEAAQATAAAQSGESNTEKKTDDKNDDSGNTASDSGTDDTEEEAKTVVIVIDPGHGGSYTGAVYNKVNEKDLTLKTAKYARDYLLENYKNVEVYLTRRR